MPGAWELMANPSVLVGILHVDSTCMAWSLGFRNLIIPRGDIMPIAGMPYDHGRNAGCQRCLEGGYDYLFWLDSDVIPPRDALLRLLAHRLPIVSGLYCRRSPPHGVPVMIKNGQWVTQFPMGALVEVDLVGAGCLLLHRSVLERLPPQRPEAGKHWFDWRVDMQGRMPPEYCLSEDFTFVKACKEKLGISTYVDTSVQCRHVGLAEATYGNFVPCNATPIT
jgi:hypothetical protein